MKKNSVMVKQVLMSILTAGIFSFAFTACSDEDILSNEDPLAMMENAKTKQVIGDGDITAEPYAACIPYQVKANGACTSNRTVASSPLSRRMARVTLR